MKKNQHQILLLVISNRPLTAIQMKVGSEYLLITEELSGKRIIKSMTVIVCCNRPDIAFKRLVFVLHKLLSKLSPIYKQQ